MRTRYAADDGNSRRASIRTLARHDARRAVAQNADMPVCARRGSARGCRAFPRTCCRLRFTTVADHVEFVDDGRCRRACRAPCGHLQRLARTNCAFMIGVIGAALPSSLSGRAAGSPARAYLGLHVGELLLISWFAASGRPNCLRSSTYWRAACQQNSAARAHPRQCRSARFSAAHRALQSFTFGSRFPRHEHVVHHISPVIDARRLNLPRSPARQPLHAFFETKPRTVPSSSFAQTTNTSAIGELEIHILLPESR